MKQKHIKLGTVNDACIWAELQGYRYPWAVSDKDHKKFQTTNQ